MKKVGCDVWIRRTRLVSSIAFPSKCKGHISKHTTGRHSTRSTARAVVPMVQNCKWFVMVGWFLRLDAEHLHLFVIMLPLYQILAVTRFGCEVLVPAESVQELTQASLVI